MTDPIADLKAAVSAAKNFAITNSVTNQAAIASLKAQLDEIMGVESKNEALKLLAEGVDLLVKGEQLVVKVPTGTWKNYAYAAAAGVAVLLAGGAALFFHWI